MIKVSKTWSICNSIHADAWTETLTGMLYLIDQVEHLENTGNTDSKIYITRLAIISSSYLAEQIFVQASKLYVDEVLADDTKDATSHLTKRILKEWKNQNSIKRVGVYRAMEEWPEVLTGAPLKLGEEPLQSLKIVIDKRNDIIHTLSDLTRYQQAADVTRSALYTAVEASKNIWAHFFPDTMFPYNNWLSVYPIQSACFFGRLKT